MACCMMLLISHDHHQPALPTKQVGNLNMHEYARLHKTWVSQTAISSSLALFLLEGSELSLETAQSAQEAGAITRRALLGSRLCSEANCAKKMAVVFSL